MQKFRGFTLAEVLITLSIIGVVAALTIPELVKNMNDYAFGKSKEVTLAKITEATNQMKSNDVLSGYATNDAFVSEFQKYMKVTKTCDSTTLVNCFPAKFTTGTGEEIKTTTLITGTKLGNNNITGNTIAMMLANGTSILFSLRDSTKVGTACDRIDPTSNTSDTTGCLSFLYDINGYGSPNVMGKDIGVVNAQVTSCDGKKVGTICYSAPFKAVAITNAECEAQKGLWGINNCYYDYDNWAGAVKACYPRKIVSQEQLAEIVNEVYGVSGCTPTTNCTGTFDPVKAASYGLTAGAAVFTSHENAPSQFAGRSFDATTPTRWGFNKGSSTLTAPWGAVICVTE